MNHPRKLFLNYRNNLLMLHKNLCAKQRKKIFCTSYAGHDGGRAFSVERSMVQHPFGNPGIQGFPGDEESLSGS